MKQKIHQPPIPPFDRDAALAKVRATEDAWNSRSLDQVVDAISPECVWRSREDSFQGRAAIKYFLKKKWTVESHFRLMKELWCFTDNHISVRFECEWQHVKTGQWYRSHGNEHWQFDSNGYMTQCDTCANDTPITANERKIYPTTTNQENDNETTATK